jgi:PhnB protein
MATVNIYLNFNGNCEEAFGFYRSVLGGEFSYMSRFNEMPLDAGAEPLSAEDAEKILHITLPISGETSLMGSDVIGEWSQYFIEGNNFSVSIDASSKDEAERIFAGLSEGGQVIMPMGDTFWGSYFGMFTDKFGINWMVSAEQS